MIDDRVTLRNHFEDRLSSKYIKFLKVLNILVLIFLIFEIFIFGIYLINLQFYNPRVEDFIIYFGFLTLSETSLAKWPVLLLIIIIVVLSIILKTKSPNKFTKNYKPDAAATFISIFYGCILYFSEIVYDPILSFLVSLILAIIILILATLVIYYTELRIFSTFIFVFFAISIIFQSQPYVSNYHDEFYPILISDLLWRQALIFAMPILLTASGAAFNERVGVINIGLEGIMISGAFAAIFFTFVTGDIWIGVLMSIIIGVIVGFIHALFTITFKSEQIVTGVAINLLAAGITGLMTKLIWQAGSSDRLTEELRSPMAPINFLDQDKFHILARFLNLFNLELYRDIPVIGPILKNIPNFVMIFNNHRPVFYLSVLIILLMHILLFKTHIGLRMRTIGEHPEAAATAGINVHLYQYIAVIISGALAGLGGGVLSIGVNQFGDNIVSGRGFIALAVMIFGKWTILGGAAGALFLGVLNVLRTNRAFSRLVSEIPIYFTEMIPNIIVIAALAGMIGKAIPPKALGTPYSVADGD
jgi:general nucleoside transport system permease protein